MLTHIHPSQSRFACKTSSSIKGTGCPSSKSGAVPEPPSAQSPFARLGRYLRRRGVQHLVEGRYPSFPAPTNSCARPKSSPRLWSMPWSESLCRLSSVPAGRWPFPMLSPQSVLRRLDPYPAAFLGVCPFRPMGSTYQGRRPHHRGTYSSARWTFPAMQLQPGVAFRGGSHSLMFRLPSLLGPPVAPTAVLSTGRPGRLRHAMNMWSPALISQGFT